MKLDEKNNLKLIGKNKYDLKVISAYLQDSVLKVKDIVFLKKNNTVHYDCFNIFFHCAKY